MTLSITDTQHNNALHYDLRCYAECHALFIVMLSVIMLNGVMLSVVAPSNIIRFSLKLGLIAPLFIILSVLFRKAFVRSKNSTEVV
jgi:hypothetical protein